MQKLAEKIEIFPFVMVAFFGHLRKSNKEKTALIYTVF